LKGYIGPVYQPATKVVEPAEIVELELALDHRRFVGALDAQQPHRVLVILGMLAATYYTT
jgi:hypothetical protein